VRWDIYAVYQIAETTVFRILVLKNGKGITVIPIERHQSILALVEQRGAVSINELTETLGVSHMTIRRDVSKLEEEGLLVSVSGGVAPSVGWLLSPATW
jgi:predicted HTH transcriptional regulator